jgi:hypothetical protein
MFALVVNGVGRFRMFLKVMFQFSNGKTTMV